MQLRLIEKDAKDLPANFAVVEGKTVAEGIANLCAAFNRPGISLAVWNDAADLIPADEKNDVRRIMSFREMKNTEVNGFTGVDPKAIAPTASADLLFNQLARHMRQTKKKPPALNAWRTTLRDVLQELDATFGLAYAFSALRFRRPAREPDFHQDNTAPAHGVLLRTAGGDATVFLDARAKFEMRGQHVVTMPDPAHLWTVRPWSFALMAGPNNVEDCFHTEPYKALHPEPDYRAPPRVLEKTVFATRNPMFTRTP